jgi:hypothetical protein
MTSKGRPLFLHDNTRACTHVAAQQAASIGIGTSAKSFLEAFQIPSNTQNSADFR